MRRPTTATLLASAPAAALAAVLPVALLAPPPALAATPFISELYFDPPSGSGDRLQEYLEISGASGQDLDGIYLLQLENENNAFGTGNQGRVDLGFNLATQSLGRNGRLVIASANGGVANTGRPAHVFDPASTLVQGTTDFFGYFGAPGLLTDVPANQPVRTENSGGTYLLVDINGGAAPVVGQDYDPDDDGVLDLPAGYSVLDAVGLTSEPGEQNFGGLYGFTNFVVGTPGPDFDVDPSTVTEIDFEIEYLAREANSNAFFVANLTDGPNLARGGPDVPVDGARYVISAEDTVAGSQTGDPEVSIALPYGSSPLTPGGRTDVVLGLRGDFDQSGALDAPDIDALFAARGALSAENAGFDLSVAAGPVDTEDARVLVEDLLGTRFGDANLDGVVGNADIGAVFGSFGTASGAGWADGSFDGDGDVDNGDIGTVFGNFGFDASGSVISAVASLTSDVANPPAADLLYDPTDGSVVLDGSEAVGGVITNFVLTSDGAFLNTDGLTNPFLGVFFTATLAEISASDPLTAGLGLIDLGVILASGLSETDLQNILTGATYVGALGSGQVSFDLVVVPEPTSLALLGLGGITLAARRRAAFGGRPGETQRGSA